MARSISLVASAALALAGAPALAQTATGDEPPGKVPQEQAAAAPEAGDVIPGDVSATATIASQYVFRGISQSDEHAAIQGSLDWKHPTGAFVGVWGSSVDFNDGDRASAELDWYGGWAGEAGPVGLDVRAIYYSYPGADTPRDYDYWEIGAAVTHAPFANLELTAGYNYSPDFFNESGDGHYLHAEAAYAIGGWRIPLTVSGGIGYQWIEDNVAFGAPDYLHWSVGVGTTIEGIELAVTYSDTDLSRRECSGGLDTCGGRVVFSASASL